MCFRAINELINNELQDAQERQKTWKEIKNQELNRAKELDEMGSQNIWQPPLRCTNI